MSGLRRLAVLAIWIVMMMAGYAAPSHAQNIDAGGEKLLLEKPQEVIERWGQSFESLQDDLSADDITGRILLDGRTNLERTVSEIREFEALARTRLERLNAAMEKLGPKPEEGAVDEAPELAAERKRLSDEITRISGLQKQAELAGFRGNELMDQVARVSRERFTRRIFGRVDVPLDPLIWQQSWSEATQFPDLVRARYSDDQITGQLIDHLSDVAPGLILLLCLVVAGLIGSEVLVLRWLPARWKNVPPEDHIALISGTRFLLTVLVPGTALLIMYQVFEKQGNLMAGSTEDFIHQCFSALIFMIFVGASVRSIFSPFAPEMRRVGTTVTGARMVGFLALLNALIFAGDMVLLQGATTLGASLDLALVQSVTNVLLISALMFVATMGRWWDHSDPDRKILSSKVERRTRRTLRIISIVIPVLALVGYVSLARFLLENIMVAAAFVISFWVLREYARALVHTYLVKPDVPRDENATSDAVHGTLYFWLRVTVDAVLVTIAVPMAILLFTDTGWEALIAVTEAAFIGVQIGTINISLRAILVAILLFLVLLSVMRFFQRMLNTRVLPNTKLDQGLQHSVSAIFGYVGIILAVLLAVSAAGVDLSNLAIIAGAISVGIGFGMQSIVNNFVSGLILLIERPIKVGDWIVVGADQGLVKDIRVRATEIETFDRSSVVIPNSELISNRVMNWTLTDRNGRGIVRIGVAYGSDAEKVRSILLDIADSRTEILSYPAPQVVFMDFGASSLDFELRFFLRDISNVLAVSSAIRFEILERFRTENVEIPFPQQDLHLRDIDRLEDAIRSIGQGNPPPRKEETPVAETPEPAPEPMPETGTDSGKGGQDATPSAATRELPDDGDAK
ncbi:DUF3772 domain-containing protein [Thalassospira sp.]|uniref:DUF3772 domain-containing protein n=1 Tax=Thalassospira sp. TaxID=1912094 RepID=UPI002732A0F0|nr:DUF3772 domain-containing protein [Thalassospira sp.]MDP2699478.1 DUF3772 domain-containing protein [Thalassospira sp.]